MAAKSSFFLFARLFSLKSILLVIHYQANFLCGFISCILTFRKIQHGRQNGRQIVNFPLCSLIFAQIHFACNTLLGQLFMWIHLLFFRTFGKIQNGRQIVVFSFKNLIFPLCSLIFSQIHFACNTLLGQLFMCIHLMYLNFPKNPKWPPNFCIFSSKTCFCSQYACFCLYPFLF